MEFIVKNRHLIFIHFLLILLLVAFKYCPLPLIIAPVYKLIIFSLLFALIVSLYQHIIGRPLEIRNFITIFILAMVPIIITLAGVSHGVIPNHALIKGIFVLIFFYMLSTPFLRK
jgi:hypothetical protein